MTGKRKVGLKVFFGSAVALFVAFLLVLRPSEGFSASFLHGQKPFQTEYSVLDIQKFKTTTMIRSAVTWSSGDSVAPSGNLPWVPVALGSRTLCVRKYLLDMDWKTARSGIEKEMIGAGYSLSVASQVLQDSFGETSYWSGERADGSKCVVSLYRPHGGAVVTSVAMEYPTTALEKLKLRYPGILGWLP